MKTPSIKGIKFLSLIIDFYCIVDRNLYDFGAVRLECDGRTFILDVVQSYTNDENNHTTITCDLKVDLETFPKGKLYDSNYDLEAIDFESSNLKACVYIGEDYEVEPDSITLFIKSGKCTKAIEVKQE